MGWRFPSLLRQKRNRPPCSPPRNPTGRAEWFRTSFPPALVGLFAAAIDMPQMYRDKDRAEVVGRPHTLIF